jgi:phthiocerol/phenolphthiocerol synthesis type-I polyketide synthase E
MEDVADDAGEPSGALAVVGMAGRFPGAADVAAFWRNLCDGVESVTFSTPQELAEAGLPESVYGHPSYVPAKGKLDGVDLFDADFFGFNAHEAEMTDPQHRLFLECAWEALEDAGHDPARFDGRIGAYAGQSMNTYLLYNAMRDPSIVQSFYLDYMPMMISANDDFLATRLAYKLDLRGPAMTVQTACSTSLVAIHQACQSLLLGECDMALAGGVGLTIPEAFGHIYREGAGLSLDGHCRAFDRATSGIVGGSGLGIVVLRRLADAVRDGDVVHAVVRGSAVNNDGAGKAGFTAPSVDGQAQVVADALAVAGVSADSVGLVEAHGTATALGDPIEVAALTQAFRADSDRVGFCALGSVKTNVGHLAAAAGVTGFMKAVLAVRDGVVPATLHFREPNPKLALESSPFFVNAELMPWPAATGPRRAGVSALGVGGTNAHILVEQPPARQGTAQSREWQLVLVSGRSPGVVQRTSDRLAGALAGGDVSLPDAAYTLQVGRRHFDHRRAVVCRDAGEAAAALRAAHDRPERVVHRPVAFLFPGGGSQYVGMGRSLYRDEPVFREQVDACAELAAPGLGYDLRSILLADADGDEGRVAAERLATSAGMLTSLFAVDYALARLWMSWGIRPHAMLGHSLGEYVAACLAGVFDLPDAIGAVLTRSRLMDERPDGAMLSVSLPADELRGLLTPDVSLSAVNAPDQCTVGGTTAAVDELAGRLAERGVEFRRLHVHQPSHSRVMEPILDRFAEHLRGITLHPPRERFLSNVTGTWITDAEATDPGYWVRHLRGTVRFADAARILLDIPNLALVEVGPGTALSTLASANVPPDRPGPPIVASLHHPRDPRPDQQFVLTSLGRLWTSGVEVDWSGFWHGERRLRVPLPTYPFERRRYWIEPPDQTPSSNGAAAAGPGNGARPDSAGPRGAGLDSAGLDSARPDGVRPDGAARAGGAWNPEPSAQPVRREADFGRTLHQRPQLLNEYVAPTDELERAVAEAWQELLGFDNIGIHDNFFALGGSSLLTMRLLTRLRERFTADLPLEELLVTHTVADQARIIRGLLAEANRA